MIVKIMLCLSIVSLAFLVGCAGNKRHTLSDEEITKVIEGYNAKVKHSDDKVICKKSIPTGTMFTHRVCKLQRDWDLLRHQALQILLKPGVQ